MHLQEQVEWDRGAFVAVQEASIRPLDWDGSRRGLAEEWEGVSRAKKASSSTGFMLDAWRRRVK
jgi:hypothetical protein